MIAVAPRASGFALAQRERMLVASLGERARTCSWAIVGGGIGWASNVAWIEVRDEELRPPTCARAFAEARLSAAGVGDAVGVLTSRRVSAYETARLEDGALAVHAVATVGLGNALRAGDPAGPRARIGTINLLVFATAPLTDEALIEASAIATEAKTAAVMEAKVSSRRSGLTATGTGTDCVVVAAADGARAERYAGKHTALGALVGAAALDVVRRGVDAWLEENGR